jgi:hypothetical protein
VWLPDAVEPIDVAVAEPTDRSAEPVVDEGAEPGAVGGVLAVPTQGGDDDDATDHCSSPVPMAT